MENKIFEIKRESLVNILKDSFKKNISDNFNWTGWRIPIYLNEEEKTISSGNFLSNTSWVPDLHELPIKVETWNMGDLGYEEYDEEDISYEIDNKIDFYIKQLEEYYDEYIKYLII